LRGPHRRRDRGDEARDLRRAPPLPVRHAADLNRAAGPTPIRSPSGSRRDTLVAVAVFVATLAIFGTSRVHQFADSYYSMLLSEHLLTRGSFVLDEHFALPLDPARYPGLHITPGGYPYQIEVVDSHAYYF